jgi:hypothetical protein
LFTFEASVFTKITYQIEEKWEWSRTLFTKCQTLTFLITCSHKLPWLTQWLHQLPTLGVDKYIIGFAKFQANNYTKSVFWVSSHSRSNVKTQS